MLENICSSPLIAYHVRAVQISRLCDYELVLPIINYLGRFPNLETLAIRDILPLGIGLKKDDGISGTVSATVKTLKLAACVDIFGHLICGFPNLRNLMIVGALDPFRWPSLPLSAECHVLRLQRLEIVLILTSSIHRWLSGLNVEIHADLLRLWLVSGDRSSERLRDMFPEISRRIGIGSTLKHLEIDLGATLPSSRRPAPGEQ
ncbi:hypothetical protein PHLCEN_2v6426 [Hermanssonia centrifuga]|uniref:Uncharacterized protein n=1 Tax=Hermanssonia centrifuga TaxID=98765 RepID=A0A2R6NZF1_9APHY|nr:hypothetical protein PHLCEN_2v6426 [Hermanssonia centrifuga]